MKHKRDVGLKIGEWITRQSRRETLYQISDKAGDAHFTETTSLLYEDDEPPGYRTTDGTPRQQVSRSQSPSNARLRLNLRDKEGLKLQPNGLRQTFTRQVVLNILGYGILA